MELAAIIISTISLLLSMASIIWLLAKQLSTHNIQMVPVDPFKDMTEPSQIGKNFMDEFRDLDNPITADELASLAKRRK
jgi:hypothetical protein